MHITFVYHGRYHVREALDLETLAEVIRQGGHEVDLVYDADTFGVTDNVFQAPWLARRLSSPGKVAGRVAQRRPGVVIFSVLPNTFQMACDTAREVKRLLDVPIVFIGLHPSLAPERCLRERAVDYVVQGETEGVVRGLLDALGGKGVIE